MYLPPDELDDDNGDDRLHRARSPSSGDEAHDDLGDGDDCADADGEGESTSTSLHGTSVGGGGGNSGGGGGNGNSNGQNNVQVGVDGRESNSIKRKKDRKSVV